MLFYYIVSLSLMGSILAAGLMIIKRLFRQKLGANWHYYIWLVLVLRLIIPFTQSVPNVLNFIPVHQQMAGLLQISTAGAGENNTAAAIETNGSNTTIPAKAVSGAENTQPSQLLQTKTWFNWDTLALVWISGVAAIFLYILFVNGLLSLRARKLQVCDSEDILKIVNECKSKLNVRTKVTVLYDTTVKSPAVFGLFHPKISISPGIVEKLSAEELSYIFMHELSHLKRGDLQVNTLVLAMQTIYWFNPFLFYALHRMKQDCEIACDANALSSLKPEDHKKYGQTIISMLQLLSEPTWAPGTLGFTDKFNSRRIIMISKFRKTKIIWAVAALALTVLVGCSSLNNPIGSSAPTQNQETTVVSSQQTSDNNQTATTATVSTSTSVSNDSGSVVYKNIEYGFNFTLPENWKGYSIVYDEWDGMDLKGGTGAAGPMISIRDPRWTSNTPRQDIPIMIFTLDQWNSLQKGEFHIGAAPINPSELGRNNVYVFALPARYNYAFPPGYQEVDTILQSHPLKAVQVQEQSAGPAQSLITDIMNLARQGKIINCDFSAKANTIGDVQKLWGKADSSDYVADAGGTYFTYTNSNVVFGVNKGDQIFEVRSFSSRLKSITLSEVKKVLGTPARDVKNNGQEFIGYNANSEFKLEMVFPEPTSSNPDPAIDHYNVLYPAGTVNTMKGDSGRQW